jgi:hypothetical protein
MKVRSDSWILPYAQKTYILQHGGNATWKKGRVLGIVYQNDIYKVRINITRWVGVNTVISPLVYVYTIIFVRVTSLLFDLSFDTVLDSIVQEQVQE